MDILKELFLGNISPDVGIGKSDEYKKAKANFCSLADAFEKSLDNEMVQNFNKIIEAQTEMFEIENEETFKVGFSLGVHIMCACFCEN